ncbi:MAG: formylglycine-generating enzyme family protein [Fimbriimonadaceae bacterium]
MIAARLLLLGAVVILIGCGKEAREPSPTGMTWIPGGTFTMGSERDRADEAPAHSVALDGFWIDNTEVTNGQFAEFVKATKYQTVAEKNPDIPGVPKEKLVPGALVFKAGAGWTYVPGANWRHPEGPGSTIEKKLDHPVVQVCWEDAAAYAKWAGKTLPTEAQFEYAARGGRTGARYSWGDAPPVKQANFWQGSFPEKNDNTDGFLTTSPVRSFEPNGFGLYDMAGNVWEWCQDWYRPDAYKSAASKNPSGPPNSNDPDEPGMPKRVVRGGSYLCADCYCQGYRLTARMKSSPDTGLMHTGFRCVKLR